MSLFADNVIIYTANSKSMDKCWSSARYRVNIQISTVFCTNNNQLENIKKIRHHLRKKSIKTTVKYPGINF